MHFFWSRVGNLSHSGLSQTMCGIPLQLVAFAAVSRLGSNAAELEVKSALQQHNHSNDMVHKHT